jgi:hypothetical protein
VALERFQGTPVGNVNSVAGNPVPRAHGDGPDFSCGLWVQFAPLTPGDHTVQIRGTSENVTTSVDYVLHVSPGGPS